MRAIRKNSEPRSLTQHRCTAHANYANYGDKDGLRAALCAEQGHICCYCMKRIRPDSDHMKIEHWHCRDSYPAEELVYGNLLAACNGSEGQPRSKQHCDTRKGDSLLSWSPADQNHNVETVSADLGDGRIQSSDRVFNRELNDVLNLNEAFLINSRKAVLESFQQRLSNGSLNRNAVSRMLVDWSNGAGGELREFCGVVIHWLNKKLARC